MLMSENLLFYGDNLDILRRYIKDETVDLIYLDPPFKSNQDYNVLFAESNGTKSHAQIKAFEDTWHWDIEAEKTYQDVVIGGGKVSDVMQAFRNFLGENDMMAYLVMMAPRLVELRRVLKPTGSIYLHCDTTASHYLKILMDSIFELVNFRNEIIWKRAQPKSHTSVRMSRAHDVILFYVKSDKAEYKKQFKPHDSTYLEDFYKYVEEGTGRRYRLGDLTNPNKNRPNLTYEFPPGSGTVRVWRWTKDRMMKAWEDGIVLLPPNGDVVCEKRYLDEMEGSPITDIWTDIEHLHGTQQESLGYPTQKPEALLERIIEASSNEGDVVLDPFCGCGTTISVAQRLNRAWIGIDITHLAISLMKHRLKHAFNIEVGKDYKVIGEPTALPDAEDLAQQDPYQFQWWALGLVGARPVEQKKGADRGIDGKLIFFNAPSDVKPKQIIFSVKAGNVTVSHVRDLRGVVEREKAAIGVLISLNSPTSSMQKEAVSAGFYISPELGEKRYPKIQLLTISELFEGKNIECPPFIRHGGDMTFKKAEKANVQKNDTKTKQKTL